MTNVHHKMTLNLKVNMLKFFDLSTEMSDRNVQ